MSAAFRPIQKKLMRLIMLTCGLVLLLSFTALFVYEYYTYRNIERQGLSSLGEIVAANSTSSLAFDNQADAAQVLSSLRMQRHIVAARLYDAEGRLFAVYGVLKDSSDIRPQRTGYQFHARYLEGYTAVVENGKRQGTLYLRSDLGALYGRLNLYTAIALAILGLSALLALLFSRRLQRTLSEPILKLASAAGVVSQDRNYTVRVAHKSNDELGQLTVAFNDMLGQIEAQNTEIHSLNQNLERKVEERTRQLQETNRSLLEQKEFTETIIEASIDLIAVFDREHRYLAINEVALRSFRKTREELLGRSIPEVFPALRNTRIEQMLDRSFQGEFIRDDAYRSRISDRFLQNYFIPLHNAQGGVDRVLLIGHDITEIMETQTKLQALNNDLEKSNRDLEQFAYIASHDLQEPLRKIQTFADLSTRNLLHPEILQRYLGKIASSAERMSSLIRDVLNYSRLTRVDDTKQVPVDLNTVLSQVRTDLELLIEEKGAQLIVEELPTISGNALQLSQLFFNLLGNALKFTRVQPMIRVSSSWIQGPTNIHGLPLGYKTRYAEIKVADNGIGFEPQYADKIFAIFQRLHAGTEYAGTGIGLALCKKIVENHGGAISVESVPDQGTTFFIYLPVWGAESINEGDVVMTATGSQDRD